MTRTDPATTDPEATTDPGATTGSEALSGRARWMRSRRVWVGTVLVLLAVAGLVLLLIQLGSLRAHDRLERRRTAAVRAATAEVTALLSLRPDTSTTQLAKLRAGATAGFRTQIGTVSKAFQQQLATNKVSVTGKIDSAALASLNSAQDNAVVIVAATASVTSSASGSAQPRSFRFSMRLARSGSTWLVADLAFVA